MKISRTPEAWWHSAGTGSAWLAVTASLASSAVGYVLTHSVGLAIAAGLFAYLAAVALRPAVAASQPWLAPAIAAGMVAMLGWSWLGGSGSGLTLAHAVAAPAGLWLIQVAMRRAARNPAKHPVAPLCGIAALQPYDLFVSSLNQEMSHSRRYERSFCHVVLRFSEPLDRVSDTDSKLIGNLFNESVRVSDQVYASLRDNEVLLLCPETDIKGAMLFVNRLRRGLQDLRVAVNFGWAEFPSEALTTEVLRKVARHKLDPKWQPTEPMREPAVAQRG